MSKSVLFYLGPTTGLASRQLTIVREMRAGDDTAPSAAYDSDVGAVETASVTLADNTIWHAKLVDTRTSGEEATPQTLIFNTLELQFPGKAKLNSNSFLRVLAMEDNSSSSSTSSSSTSSSSSSTSSSSQSA